MRMRNLIIVMAILAASIPSSTYAGRLARKAKIKLQETKERAEEMIEEKLDVSGKLKHGAKSILKSIPGGGVVTSILDQLDGGGMEEKVDRIDKRQKTSLDRIREIAHEALETKKKVEEMYYFKRRSQQQAEFLAKGLKKGKLKNFLGAIVENGLQIPINPAEYIPSIPGFKKLKENLDLDLSFERSMIGEGKHLLSNTRSALLASNLIQTNQKQFDKEYEQAEAYEAKLNQALKAKQVASVKIYKAEIDRLEKEIKLLEEAKAKRGLTVGDLMQMELAIDSKRRDIRELNEKITASIQADLVLTDEEKEKIAVYKASKDLRELDDFLEKDRQRIREKYSHLWSF
jgi:hypothetical protein